MLLNNLLKFKEGKNKTICNKENIKEGLPRDLSHTW